MPSLSQTGQKIELLDLLPPDDGEIHQYYGRIGCGKTYAVTADILDELKRGQVVYANWRIDWQGYDQRTNRFWLLLGALGLKRQFWHFPKENFHYFPVDDDFTDKISRLTDCKVYLDEGHIAFDSYEMAKMSLAKREAVLHTRHFDRSIIIISQRPSAIHVTLRANVNRFFKCEKTVDLKLFKWHLLRFRVTEFQDVTDSDKPDETRIRDKDGRDTDEYLNAVSTRSYWGRKKIMDAYDTKYLRGTLPVSQKNAGELYQLTPKQCWENLTKKPADLTNKDYFSKLEKIKS